MTTADDPTEQGTGQASAQDSELRANTPSLEREDQASASELDDFARSSKPPRFLPSGGPGRSPHPHPSDLRARAESPNRADRTDRTDQASRTSIGAPRGRSVRLPSGVSDLLPPQARALRDHAHVAEKIFEIYGYERVVTPLFELHDVLERGLGEAAKPSVFRFVDPATGEVVVLRPDFTAQIARLVSAHLSERPRPLRLHYEGRVARAADPLGRGLAHRELFQAGLELIGTSEPWADLEVLSIGLACFQEFGRPLTLDLCHAGIVEALIEGHRADMDARQALAVKDPSWLRNVAPALVPLIDLYGEREVLARARRELRAAPRGVHQAIDELESIANMLEGSHPGIRLTFDLGEQRSLGYYSGPFFHGYVAGGSDAVMVGGRYDHLLGRFGADEPAVGLAIDIGTLAETNTHAPASGRSGFVMAEPDPRRPQLGEETMRRRGLGQRTAVVAAEDAEHYAFVNGYLGLCRPAKDGSVEEILFDAQG